MKDEQMKKVFKVMMCGCPLWFFLAGLAAARGRGWCKIVLNGRVPEGETTK